MATTLTDLANETWSELGQPSSISIPAIAFYFKTNIGRLNLAIYSNYSIINNDFSPQLLSSESVIFKSLFMIHFYDMQINANLGAAGISTTLSVDSDGSEVKLINRNDLAKTYLAAKKDFTQLHKEMVSNYISNLIGPIDVHGNDNISYTYNYHNLIGYYSNRCGGFYYY